MLPWFFFDSGQGSTPPTSRPPLLDSPHRRAPPLTSPWTFFVVFSTRHAQPRLAAMAVSPVVPPRYSGTPESMASPSSSPPPRSAPHRRLLEVGEAPDHRRRPRPGRSAATISNSGDFPPPPPVKARYTVGSDLYGLD